MSKQFYVEHLGFSVVDEHWRAERQSSKCDLECGGARLELLSFPTSPPRPSRPEARGLRHLAFAVDSISDAIEYLQRKVASLICYEQLIVWPATI